MRLREQMPELAGATKWLNSNPIKKRDLIGKKPSFIHFWSVSCDTCKRAMPKVNRFRDEYNEQLNIIAVHMPRMKEDLDIELIQTTATEHDITQPVFVDNDQTLSDAFHIKIVPAYYLFDTEGRLRHYHSGDGGMRLLHKRVNRLLGHTKN
ncbi:TlpA family protein disulfide reductase [Virgibacillus ihumii]|uniref:TlpA family protein disulfide reductase n=1 Tax=Virgibacillus ihumii TaxID=2686091 RepID=UPI00157CA249|nr:redoxin domain-containing protein [Virgibacillus ihumii]